jgi:hypothetical protein
MSVKNSSDNIGNRARDLPACSAVPQPTAPPRTPLLYVIQFNFSFISVYVLQNTCIYAIHYQDFSVMLYANSSQYIHRLRVVSGTWRR